MITDRFDRWGKLLREEQATPVLMIGLTAAGGDSTLILTTVEEMTDAQIKTLLRQAITLLSETDPVKRTRI